MDYQLVTRSAIRESLNWQGFPPCEFHSQSGIVVGDYGTLIQQITVRFNTSALFSHFAGSADAQLLTSFDNNDLIDFLQSAFCSDIRVANVKESIFNGWLDFALLLTVDQVRQS